MTDAYDRAIWEADEERDKRGESEAAYYDEHGWPDDNDERPTKTVTTSETATHDAINSVIRRVGCLVLIILVLLVLRAVIS